MALVLLPITRIVPPGIVNAVVLTRIAVTVTWFKAVEHTRLLPETESTRSTTVAWRWSSGCARGTAAADGGSTETLRAGLVGDLGRALGRRRQAAPRRSTGRVQRCGYYQ